MGTQSFLLTAITFLPLLGCGALLMLRDEDDIWIRRIALAISVVEFLLSLFLLPKFDMSVAGYQPALMEDRAWIGQTIRYHMGVDGISLWLILLTTFLTPLAILCSWKSI